VTCDNIVMRLPCFPPCNAAEEEESVVAPTAPKTSLSGAAVVQDVNSSATTPVRPATSTDAIAHSITKVSAA